jgi:apolipoprotein N-acyltransferase
MSLVEFIKATFKDKQQNPSGRELTIFVFVLMVVSSWIGEQFFDKHIPQWMFVAFVSLIAAGIGLYTFEKPKAEDDQ